MDVMEKASSKKRLIDANRLKEAVTTDYYEHFTRYHDTDQIALIDMVCDDIEEATTVYAVEVVRCRECKHCDPENYHCDHPMSTAAPLSRKPDDFCSYGKRKEGAD